MPAGDPMAGSPGERLVARTSHRHEDQDSGSPRRHIRFSRAFESIARGADEATTAEQALAETQRESQVLAEYEYAQELARFRAGHQRRFADSIAALTSTAETTATAAAAGLVEGANARHTRDMDISRNYVASLQTNRQVQNMYIEKLKADAAAAEEGRTILEEALKGKLLAASETRLGSLLKKAESELTNVDIALITNMLEHAVRKNATYTEPAVKAVAGHFSSLLGIKNYLLLAELWKLPKESWIKSYRRDLRENVHIGIMDKQWDRAALSHGNNFFIYVHDETAVNARLAGLVDKNGAKIVGEAFPPDPTKHPDLKSLPDIPLKFDDLRDHVKNVLENDRLAVNVEVAGPSDRLSFFMFFFVLSFLFCLRDTREFAYIGLCCATDPHVPMRVVAAVPHAREGYKVAHTLQQWAFARFYALHHRDGSPRSDATRIRLVGVATDSCGVQLAAMIAQGTPTEKEAALGVFLIGLDSADHALMAKVGGGYGPNPFVGHADWEHLLRTFRRNLQNPRTVFTFGFDETGMPEENATASFTVLERLKSELGERGGFLHPILRFNRFMDQNGSASVEM